MTDPGVREARQVRRVRHGIYSDADCVCWRDGGGVCLFHYDQLDYAGQPRERACAGVRVPPYVDGRG